MMHAIRCCGLKCVSREMKFVLSVERGLGSCRLWQVMGWDTLMYSGIGRFWTWR